MKKKKKKNNHRSPKVLLGILALLFLPVFAYSQAVTGSVSTRIFHNTSATSNSVVTYFIVLSNGWQSGISTVTSLTLKNASGTTVYTHSGSSVNYGTVSSGLAPGKYTFAGSVSTKNNLGNVVSVSISQEIWVGYKVQWAKSLDHTEGRDQYSLKRTTVSTGIDRAYSESYNSLAANTAGWIVMSAPATTNAGSSVFFVLEATNPATFSPSDNITYVEYFYTNSSTKGIRVKARNSSNVYTMYTLSGVNLGDELRFNRDATGNAKLYLNNTTTVAHSFAKTLTAAMTVLVHTTLRDDEAIGVVSSFGYPGTAYPLSNTFATDKNTGDLTIRISPLSGFQSPYHYFVSDQPIPEMKKVYDYLKDSVVGGSVDSTTFFTGPVASTSFTARNIPMGDYHVSAFDSRGVRVLSNSYSLLPAISSDNSNVRSANEEYVSCAPRSYAMPKVYMTHLQGNSSVVFNLQELTSEHCFGLMLPTVTIGGSPVYSKIEYGFYVKNGLIYTVEKGILSTTSYTALLNAPVEVVRSGTDIQLVYNGTVLQTYTPASTYAFKVGMYFSEWGTKIRLKPSLTQVLPVGIGTSFSNNACSTSSNVSLTISYPTHTFHNVSITANNMQLYTASGTPVGTAGQTSYPSLTPGVYYLSGTLSQSIGGTLSAFQYVYVGYSTTWESQGAYTSAALPTAYIIGSSSVNPSAGVLGYGIATGKLPSGQAGWMAFTPKGVNTSDSFWLNTVSLTEAPQTGMLEPPPYNMPSMVFPVSGGMMLVSNPATQTFSVRYYSPGTPLLAERDGSGVFKLSQNGTLLGSTITGYYFGYWKPSFLIRKAASGFYGITSNFKCPVQTNDIFAHLKYELDGYYHVMNNCYVRFLYNEEYNSTILKFNIYASNMTKLYDETDFPTQTILPGENRIGLFVGDDAHCLGQGHFILEVINEKKEHFYLRFYNNACSSCAIGGGGPGGDDQ